MAFKKKFLTVFILGLCVWLGFKLNTNSTPPSVPKLENTWWGPRLPAKEDNFIRRFEVNVSDSIIEDLEHRLANHRPLQPPLEGVHHNYGINANLLQKVIDFWRTEYNWRRRERIFNKFPQYTVSVQGLKIHYIHVRPQERPNVEIIPLLLLHGWPGSVREFYEIIPKLIAPAKGKNFMFEVFVPSLPGYGFSEAPVKSGLGAAQMALLFKNFMERMDIPQYYIQGGDWGAIIVKHMAALFPEHVLGVHSNMCSISTPKANLKLFLGSLYPSMVVDKKLEGKIYPLSSYFSNLLLETGYMHLQATKPDTVGVALGDSPVGLAAYILEKFITWTNPKYRDREDGGLTERFSLISLLDNVMLYWVTGSITTSMRLYAETFNRDQMSLGMDELDSIIYDEIPLDTVYTEIQMTLQKYNRHPWLVYLSNLGVVRLTNPFDILLPTLGKLRMAYCVENGFGIDYTEFSISLPITVPSACAQFPHEIVHQPPSFLHEKYHNLLHVQEYDEGGHFAAFEVPAILAADIFTAVEKMIQFHLKNRGN